MNRRTFLIAGLGAATLPLTLPAQTAGAVRGVTAITRVFGNGQRLIAAAVEYDRVIPGASLAVEDFAVEGRVVTRVYANTTADLAEAGTDGPFVIVELSAEDAAAPLYVQVQRDKTLSPAKVAVAQVGQVGDLPGDGVAVENTATRNLIVDDFVQRSYTHASGKVLAYNLYVPPGRDPATALPLVNFMHDAGTTSTNPLMTLCQGLGAVVWADPAEQVQRPCVVIAPQFPEAFVDDQAGEVGYLDVVIDLIRDLTTELNLDPNRLYTTGQSGGGMLSIAMMIKYPEFFAAAFLVACQWPPELVKPLATQKFWVVVSQGDAKAYPGQDAIMAVMEAEGVKVARAVWSGTSTPEEFATQVAAMEGEGAQINYTALLKGTVVLPGQEDGPGPNHINTWRIAYQIAGIRDWLFRQARA